METKLEKVKNPKLIQPETRVHTGPMNLAASWYIAMRSKALGKKPKAIELFGQLLVAWRDQKGHPVIMERYCSHLSASLAIGKIVDGCLQCPYHHWRYDNSGQCVSIPEVDYIPPKARQATYITVERYGYIWVWYGSQTPLFPLPEFPAAEDRHNYIPRYFTDKTNTSMLRVLENSFDYYHVVTLHNTKVSGSIRFTLLDEQYSSQQSEPPIQKEAWFGVLIEYPFKIEGQVGRSLQILGLNPKTAAVRMDAWPSGLRVTTFVEGKEIYKLLLCTTPVNENNTILECLLMQKKTGKFWRDRLYYLIMTEDFKKTTQEDLPVWNTMKPDVGRVYCKHDQGILKFRNFYQSWVDKVE
ncbi:Rieske 2Fe-2S domain-containing protein [Tolypothrix campylonemoides VB511288]|nr:Rieske 2Fe-2S domain-containing protein [Tolypothrix campylonemoides VB511288]